ncbi:MAG TPA: hypothetical protein VMT03_12440 [Polyangia bacterium]|nr:hypothetical protein [Polyangia bacterium]
MNTNDPPSTKLTLGAGWSQVPALPAPITPSGDPTVLAADYHTIATFVQAANFGYFAGAGESVQEVSWAEYSGDVFVTPAALARLPTVHLDAGGQQEEYFIVVGRAGGSDQRMYWSEGVIAPATAGVFSPPTPVTFPAFATINGNKFVDPYGYPALAGDNTGNVTMTYIGLNASNQPTVYAQVKPFNGNWKARVAAPALPTGWTLVVGKSTIDWGYLGSSTIVVKAKKSTTTSFFRILFNGSTFYDTLGPAQWRQLSPLSGSPSIDSDAAVEWDDSLSAHTLYYRSGTKASNLYEASFTDTSFYEAFKQLIGSTTTNPAFVGSPSVFGGINLENSEHWILGRDAQSKMYMGFMEEDGSLSP